IYLYDIRNQKPLTIFTAQMNNGEITDLEISSSGRYIFAADDFGGMACYDTAQSLSSKSNEKNTGIQILSIPDNRMCMSLSGDGATMAVGSWNSEVFLAQVVC
ncbi:MAG: Guanine nucleotide-binding protein G(I)/G(S)/G(T) subunit beta-1, partial [Paramarteilia canceri]